MNNNLQKLTTDIKVPNKDLETLKIHFPHCFDKDGNFQLEKFKNNLTEKEINFSTESYGLDWLGKTYARLLASDPATTLLRPDETHNSQLITKNSENLLIKGDNLEVLKHLANAYYEKVKMIYIDPPYNTGSDGFVYNDDRKFTVKELQNLIGVDEEKAKRILSFTQSKSNSHSAWLTFMYPRLYIAKQLLKDDGVIFVSIDDNEVAQLRLLMDEVFGEENFIKDLIINTSEGGGQAKFVINGHENLLVYAKNLTYFDNLKRPKDIRGKKILINNELYWIQEDAIRKEFGKYGNLHYEEILEFKDQSFKEKIDKGIENNEYVLIPKEYGKNIIGVLRKVSEDYSKFHSILNIERISKHLTADGIKELEDIFEVVKGNSPFSNPKPIDLLKRVVLSSTFNTQNDLILDFFAGSGTTGDAVMQLNAEDGGNRKFILVQLPEPIDQKKNKTAYDFVKSLNFPSLRGGKSTGFDGVANPQDLRGGKSTGFDGNDTPTIFEITKERLLRAAKKINADLDEKIKNIQLKIKDLESQLQIEEIVKELKTKNLELKTKNLELKTIEKQKTQNSFKIFETTPIWEDYNFEAEQFDRSQTLFDAGKLTEEDIKALLTTWKTYDGIALTQELEAIRLGTEPAEVYTAYYGNGRLYLMHKGFTTDSLKALLEKIDADKHFEPKSIIAFGYHLESKNLREISENVKTYNNKKKSDIDFITRY